MVISLIDTVWILIENLTPSLNPKKRNLNLLTPHPKKAIQVFEPPLLACTLVCLAEYKCKEQRLYKIKNIYSQHDQGSGNCQFYYMIERSIYILKSLAKTLRGNLPGQLDNYISRIKLLFLSPSQLTVQCMLYSL